MHESLLYSYFLVGHIEYRLNNYKNTTLHKIKVLRNQGNEIDKLASFKSSLSRTKREIRELCFSNPFEYFCTLTVNSNNADRFSLQSCQDNLRVLLRKIKRKFPNFIYILITEHHKDGAFHFHGMMSNLDLYVNEYGYYSSHILDSLGFNSFSKIKDFNKCCNYLTKYITKDCIRNEHGQIFIRSKGLKYPEHYSIPPIDIEKWTYRDENVSFKDIYLDNPLTDNELLTIIDLYRLDYKNLF